MTLLTRAGARSRTTTTSPSPGLGRAGGVAAGLSSLVGAGLVGLPAALLHETAEAAVLTWLVAAVLCLPMIVLFRDTVRRARGGSDPLRATVTTGLGPRWGDMVPLMFGLVVVVGLPVNAVVGARSLAAATGVAVPETLLVVSILGTAVVTNLVGGRAGARAQQVGVVLLGGVLVAFVVWSSVHAPQAPDVVPSATSLATVPAGVLLAFWAFVGFENLTFLARDLARPRRDFLPVALISLALLTALAVALTVAVSLHVPAAEVDPVTGVVDVARGLPLGGGVALVVAAGVAVAVLLNALAWVRGVALVLSSAAGERLLPSWFAGPDPRQPRRAVGLLAVGFTGTVSVLHHRPDLVVDLIAAASAVFVVIYLVCIVAYARTTGLRGRTVANLALVPVLLWSLAASGPRALYAVAVLAFALAVTGRRRGRRSAPADAGVTAPHAEHGVRVVDGAGDGPVPQCQVEAGGGACEGRPDRPVVIAETGRPHGAVGLDLDPPAAGDTAWPHGEAPRPCACEA